MIGRRVAAGLVALITSGLLASTQGAAQSTPAPYSRLAPGQRQLVDRMAAEACGKCSPAAHYASWPASHQTTFEAATHGLMKTRLTDAEGKDLGSALAIIGRIERVAGEDRTRRGDEQFRLYVDLAPGALTTLAASREFFRDKDNTVFHKGYPINYRLRGRFPSVQVSVTESGDKADIDVDYLSSRVPQGLFNGHLTAANSDVRMRGNDVRHVRRWPGLMVWWKSLLDRFASPGSGRSARTADVPAVPSSSASAFAEVDRASAEFLADWFVRRSFKEALAFVSPRASVCTNLDEDTENERGSASDARRWLGEAMRGSARGPRPSTLADAIAPVQPWHAEWAVQSHPFDAAYTIAAAGGRGARAFLCASESEAIHGDAHAYVLFQLREREGRTGGALALLWARDQGAWRILSVDVLDH